MAGMLSQGYDQSSLLLRGYGSIYGHGDMTYGQHMAECRDVGVWMQHAGVWSAGMPRGICIHKWASFLLKCFRFCFLFIFIFI
jgi:hypothetical protein